MFFSTTHDAICRQLTSLIVAGLFISVLSPHIELGTIAASNSAVARSLSEHFGNHGAGVDGQRLGRALPEKAWTSRFFPWSRAAAIPASARQRDRCRRSLRSAGAHRIAARHRRHVRRRSIEHDDLGFLRPSGDQKRRATQRQDRRHRPTGDSGCLRNAGRTEEIGADGEGRAASSSRQQPADRRRFLCRSNRRRRWLAAGKFSNGA